MATRPKTSVEILAAAKQSFRPRKFELADYKTHLSTFSVDPSADISCAPTSLPLQSWPTTSNVHSIGSTYYFNDPTTPQTLQAAVKLKETKDKEPEDSETEDLFDDVPADTPVLSCTQYYMLYLFLLSEAFTASEPESPTDSVSSSQSRMSLSDRILDMLILFRQHRLSPLSALFSKMILIGVYRNRNLCPRSGGRNVLLIIPPPFFNAPIFLQNKSQIGKVDEILGPVNEVYFSVKMGEGMVANSFKKGDKVYIAGDKLLPIERFLPKPKVAGGTFFNSVLSLASRINALCRRY
jgi:H/ACA ribonucleoprotein complex subunit 1